MEQYGLQQVPCLGGIFIAQPVASALALIVALYQEVDEVWATSLTPFVALKPLVFPADTRGLRNLKGCRLWKCGDNVVRVSVRIRVG